MNTGKARIRVTQQINASPEKVFEAWTQPALMKKWFCPKNLRPGVTESDVRVDGKYRGSMINDQEGETYTATGEYREVVPGKRLVFTHGWEGPDRVETLVTVEFKSKNGGTEVVLVHERLENEESAKGHQAGWLSTLENLAGLFT
jgi:uncharacterized protein YndB with AHSA1/START domain